MEFEPLFVKAAVTTFLCLTLTTFAEGACPPIALIQKRSSSTISCVTQDKAITGAFWYKGSISHTSPILRLENGNPGGTEYGKDQYGIDSKGAMTIHNASLEQEADYFFVAFFEDDTFEKRNVTVVLTVQPDESCPKVTNCFSCEECYLNASENGSLICSMTEVRPKMNVYWITENETPGINITLHPLNITSNSNGYTWDISKGLSYTAYTCGQNFALQCIAEDDHKLLKYSTSVQIQAGNCNEDSHSNKQSILISTIVVVTIMIVVIAVTAAMRYKDRRQDQQSVQTTGDPEQKPLTSTKSAYLDTPAQKIADYLKKTYEPHCSVHVLPWVDPIPITFVNIDYELAFENAKGTTTNSSCHEILRNICLNDLHRAMITADRGNGKTYFTKQIIHQWSQEKVNSFLLIYIDVEDIGENIDIISILFKMFPTFHDFSKEVIYQVLNSSEVLILIDGLSNLSVGHEGINLAAENKEQGNSDTESGDNTFQLNATLTIKEILEDNLNKSENNVHVWVTSCGLQDTRYEFKLPYVKIKLPKFSKQQMNSYIEKTCSYYNNFQSLTKRNPEGSKMSANIKSEALSDNSDHGKRIHSEESTEETAVQNDNANSEDVIQQVQKIVKENNFLRDFEHNLLFFVLLVHIIAAKLTFSPDYLSSVKVENMASLIAATIKALLLNYSRKHTILTKEFTDKIETALEEIAFQMIIRDETIQVSFPKDTDNIARIAETVGILQKTKQGDSIEVCFSHPRVEEYLAANYISKLDKDKKESMRKTIEENHAGVWVLISCLEDLE